MGNRFWWLFSAPESPASQIEFPTAVSAAILALRARFAINVQSRFAKAIEKLAMQDAVVGDPAQNNVVQSIGMRRNLCLWFPCDRRETDFFLPNSTSVHLPISPDTFWSSRIEIPKALQRCH